MKKNKKGNFPNSNQSKHFLPRPRVLTPTRNVLACSLLHSYVFQMNMFYN